MPPARRKGGGKAAAAAAPNLRQWKVGDLVLAKVKGFPAWPATVSEPEKWGYTADWKKVLVYFFGTKQIAFCNPADVEAFTEEKKRTLLLKSRCRGRDFIRAVDEIIESYEKYGKHSHIDVISSGDEGAISMNTGSSKSEPWKSSPEDRSHLTQSLISETLGASDTLSHSSYAAEISETSFGLGSPQDSENLCEETLLGASVLNQLRQTPVLSMQGQSMSSNKSNSFSFEDIIALHKSKSSSSLDINKNDNRCEFHDLDLLVYSATVVSNTSEEVESGTAAIESEVASTKHAALKEYSECGKVDLGSVVVLKKKRKQNTKRIDRNGHVGHMSYGKQFFIDYHERGDSNDRDVSGYREGCAANDGDEHLPLVKRARARMGNQPADKRWQFRDCMVTEKLEVIPGINKTAPKFEGDHPSSTNLIDPRNGLNNSLMNLDVHSNDSVCKVKDEGLRNHSAASETILPPLKRMRRALEAMSINMAEESKHMKCLKIDVSTLSTVSIEDSLAEVHASCLGSSSTINNSETNLGVPETIADGTTKIAESDASGMWGNPNYLVEREGCMVSNSNSPNSNICAGPLGSGGSVSSVHATNLHVDLYALNELPDFASNNNRCSQLINNANQNMSGNQNLHDFAHDCGGRHCLEVDQMSQSAVFAPEMMKFNFARKQENVMSCSSDRETDASVQGCCDGNGAYNGDLLEIGRCKQATHHILGKEKSIASSQFFDNILGNVHNLMPVCGPSQFTGFNSLEQISSCSKNGGKNDSTYELNNDKIVQISNNGNTYLEREVVQPSPCVILEELQLAVQSLSMSKEGINEATRLALNCAEHGIADEVIDLFVNIMGKECSLNRKMDLLLLVDSIAQSSFGERGKGWSMCTLAMEKVVPHILAAATPEEVTTEIHRQCLDILKVWLERNILPESIIKQHIEAFSCGSNLIESSAPDQGLDANSVQSDESGSPKSPSSVSVVLSQCKNIETIVGTKSQVYEDIAAVNHSEVEQLVEDHIKLRLEANRHCDILEKLDGELEMEDATPICDEKFAFDCTLLPFVPPLPKEKPPSPPPLPASPPPIAASIHSPVKQTDTEAGKNLHFKAPLLKKLNTSKKSSTSMRRFNAAHRGMHSPGRVYLDTRLPMKPHFVQLGGVQHLYPPFCPVVKEVSCASAEHPSKRRVRNSHPGVHLMEEASCGGFFNHNCRIQPEIYDRYGLSMHVDSGCTRFGKAKFAYDRDCRRASSCSLSRGLPASGWSFHHIASNRRAIPFSRTCVDYQIL